MPLTAFDRKAAVDQIGNDVFITLKLSLAKYQADLSLTPEQLAEAITRQVKDRLTRYAWRNE